MLEFDGKYPKREILIFMLENRKKTAVKHSIEKSVLINVVNLSTGVCPRLLYLIIIVFDNKS